jgi:alpha-amylase
MFEVHQPLRLNRNFHQDLLANPVTSKEELLKLYFDTWLNKHIFDRVARKCYLPANNIILAEIERFKREKKQFKVAYGISGVFLEQCKSWNPEVLESFQKLAATGCVEFLEETYYHSLASLWGADRPEFAEQVGMHRQLMLDLFDYRPTTFGNTECLYNNSIAKTVADLGYSAIVTEGVERILDWRSPNFVYRAKGASIPVLLRNYRLSDDIGFRFSSSWWSEWPLTAEKYASWLAAAHGQTVVLFVDYETFGEHHWPEGGIHEFLRWLPGEVFKWDHLYWRTPSEVAKLHEPVGEIDVHDFNTVSWADLERDPSAWIINPMQIVSFEFLKARELLVKGLGDPLWLRLWRYFQMSDHLYYMSVKGGGPGDVHCYFNPSGNPIDAFASFSNVLSDFEARILQELQKPELAAKWILRRLPHDKVFNFFYDFARPAGIVAYDLFEFSAALSTAPAHSLQYHVERGDFARWLRHVLRDKALATQIEGLAKERLRGEQLRKRLVSMVTSRVKQLEALSARVGTAS